MKKLTLITAVTFLAFFVSSCSKEKDCECTYVTTGSPNTTLDVHIEDGDCSDLDSEITTAGITVSTTCEEI